MAASQSPTACNASASTASRPGSPPVPCRRSTSIRRAAAPLRTRAGPHRRRNDLAWSVGSLRVALQGFLEPGVILEPARDLRSERLDIAGGAPGDGAAPGGGIVAGHGSASTGDSR